jgi:serine O-acetyltransferase
LREDLKAIKEKDPACPSYAHALLYMKGFQGVTSYRVAYKMFKSGRMDLAYCLQSRISVVFNFDLHPCAKIGIGVIFDHATGIVIGETAVVGDNCSLFHNVTLGNTGKVTGDRHPKLGNGVVVGAGSLILGNIKIGSGTKIGAGSVVVSDLPENVTAVGVPAKIVKRVTPIAKL